MKIFELTNERKNEMTTRQIADRLFAYAEQQDKKGNDVFIGWSPHTMEFSIERHIGRWKKDVERQTTISSYIYIAGSSIGYSSVYHIGKDKEHKKFDTPTPTYDLSKDINAMLETIEKAAVELAEQIKPAL